MGNEWNILIVLGLLAATIALFAFEVFSVDVITLGMLLVLIGIGILSPADAFSGFSQEIIVMLASIFVIGGALQETGVLDAVIGKLTRPAGKSEVRILFLILVVCSGLSAFMNNTTVTAMFIGPVLTLARQQGLASSRMLLPMAYASIFGGTCTLVGTSTNLAVSGFITREQMKPLGLFEITPIGLIITATGIAYLMLVGRRLLPNNPEQTKDYLIPDYLSEVVVLPESPLVGQRALESDLAKKGFRLLRAIRKNQGVPIDPEFALQAGDILVVAGNVENLIQVRAAKGFQIRARLARGDQDFREANVKIAEALVTPQSDLLDRSLDSIQREEHGLNIVAIHRRGHASTDNIGSMRLRVGDLLLVQADKDVIESLRRERELAVLGQFTPPQFKQRKGLFVVIFFMAALVIGGLHLLPLSFCFLAAALLVILFRCLTIEQAYEFIDWRLLILIGGMTAFGVAIEQTGAAQLLARGIDNLLSQLGVMGILTGYFVLTILLTQPMSNAAAALVVLPVALQSARDLGANERTFAIAIMLAASVSFIAPFEPSCILVYGPGKYRFMDFVKTGVLLTVVLAVIVLALIPVFWPLHQGAAARLNR
ncbi:MAG TPA: SLC13 family permease [Candidatus Angelobacter sp.]|nr:SLC13 family permease [Candidatus Angelobacter sp.]